MRELEVDPIVCDVYDATALAEAVSASEPDLVMLLAAARAADAESLHREVDRLASPRRRRGGG